ncbi:ADP-ribose pyrophosphatase [Paenibacillus dendritiformis]|uniref:NUDIX hydrolase n=1 Tax=Paenibacillus dendritiformis TaxID=130049 RepID=UPI001B04B8C9|nr:NUDIX hydrolase [Paenibacillus dendritiformis]GIO73992.1 ADP-ribose pyrophosphatase [Paenibacillus dendritiformis]
MLEYIKRMRSRIGHDPLLLCGASIILYNASRQVLMLNRSDNGRWCFPGGAIELGETTEEAVRRELLEETGLTVGELRLFGVFSGEELHYVYPNGDEVYIVDVVYTSNQFRGELTIDEESRAYQFFAINDLPAEISPPVAPIVAELKRRHGLTV